MATYRKVRTDMASDDSWEQFVEDGERLQGDLDGLPERAADFADGVREQVEGMIDWARENEHVTERMWSALTNMQDGVGKWQH